MSEKRSGKCVYIYREREGEKEKEDDDREEKNKNKKDIRKEGAKKIKVYKDNQTKERIDRDVGCNSLQFHPAGDCTDRQPAIRMGPRGKTSATSRTPKKKNDG